MNDNIQTDHFLVYGTLRPGCGNYDNYFPYVNHSVQNVRINGFAMFGVRGFPYAVRGTQEDSIECSLITVTDTEAKIAKLQRGLDFLEGYTPNSKHNHYDRITVEVDGKQAHLYVLGRIISRDEIAANMPATPNGNWYEVSPPTAGPYMWVDAEDEEEDDYINAGDVYSGYFEDGHPLNASYSAEVFTGGADEDFDDPRAMVFEDADADYYGRSMVFEDDTAEGESIFANSDYREAFARVFRGN